MGLFDTGTAIIFLVVTASTPAMEPSLDVATASTERHDASTHGSPVPRDRSDPSVSPPAIAARDALRCDGIADDRPAFKALVEPGGAGCGKAIVFDGACRMLWSSCASDEGDCTVATLCPGTRLVAEPGPAPNVKLAGRTCSGGTSPGAPCRNGDGDCNGGTCTYDAGSLTFAHAGSATYTLLRAASNAACAAAGTPWACCSGNGRGVCDAISQEILVDGLRIDAGQASLSAIGAGALDIVDFSGSAGAVVRNVEVYDHEKGKGIRVGPGSTVEGNTLTATRSTQRPREPESSRAHEVTIGIEAGPGSVVRRNRARGTTAAIATTAGAAQGSDALVRPR